MKIIIFPHVHDRLNEIEWKLDGINDFLKIIYDKEKKMSVELDDLTAEIKDTEDKEQKAIALLNYVIAQLAAAGTDPAALKALHDELKTNTDALAAAIAAGPVVPTA